jgi:Uma2 family endonuclease
LATLLNEPRLRPWSRDEFYQMMDLGWFLGQSVELIRGEIIEMPNQKSGHYAAIDKTSKRLEREFGPGVWVRTQAPLALPADTEPNSDVSVVSGSRDDYLAQHPMTALLVVEASDSTLRYDRKTKGSLYGSAALADYWILNLVDRQLEVYRRPIADAAGEFGFVYADVQILKPTDSVSPLAAPHVTIQVADLLP